jgi:hypothetical protein
MKILVIGEMRSRSNWFMEVLGSHLHLKNLSDPYGVLHNKAKDLNKWIETVKSITRVIHRNDNFIAKVETTEMYLGDYISLSYFSPELYDRIYVIKRDNLTDIYCSLHLVSEANQWHYRGDEIPKEFVSITVDPNKNKELLNLIRVIKIGFDRAIDYLDQHHLAYEMLEYNDIGAWLASNAENGTTDLIQPGYDYKQIFTNYDEIRHMI